MESTGKGKRAGTQGAGVEWRGRQPKKGSRVVGRYYVRVEWQKQEQEHPIDESKETEMEMAQLYATAMRERRREN
jgi:hypothetical protein